MSVLRYRSLSMARSRLHLPYKSTLAEVDYTIRVEVAVKQILCGTNVKTSASVANADCLDWYRQWNDKHQD